MRTYYIIRISLVPLLLSLLPLTVVGVVDKVVLHVKVINSLAILDPKAILIFSSVEDEGFTGQCKSGVFCPCFLHVNAIFLSP
jgi:hypothetical protein